MENVELRSEDGDGNRMDDKLTTKDAITVLRNLQDWLYFSAMNGGTSIQREALDIAIGALKQPKIIHCMDCKHRDPEDKKCDCGHGIVWQLPRADDWYCADGER